MVRAVIVQCRLSSTRLPGKALYTLGEKTILAWCLSAMKKVSADYYYVATDEKSYDELLPVCEENGFECFKGPLENVLERYCLLIKKIDADTVVRATADNPFLFYEAAQKSADEFDALRGTENECDYFTWTGLPHGSGVEIFNGKSLLKAAAEADSPFDKEHVGPALYKHQDKFKCVFKDAPKEFFAPELRTTIDTYQDYIRAFLIYYNGYLKGEKENLSSSEIINLCKSKNVVSPLVFIPSVVKGRGTGHLARCLKLAKETGGLIYIPKDNPEKLLSNINTIISNEFDNGLLKNQIISELPDSSFSPCFVTDNFILEKKDAINLCKTGTLISLDVGGKYSAYCDYLLNIIPSMKDFEKPNFRNINFLDLPKNKLTSGILKKLSEVKKVLVCFGGEDPANFSESVSKKAAEIFPDAEITCVTRKNFSVLKNINLVPQIPQLSEKLFEYDLVFTHYGLTAYEAVSANVGVILFPTTKLHKKLSEKFGFANLCIKDFSAQKVEEFFSAGKIYPKVEELAETESLSSYINLLYEGEKIACPVCNDKEKNYLNPVVSRNKFRTYRRCKNCGIVYISFSADKKTEYGKEYFFESYKNQYGRTYKEDFDSIKMQCTKRVEIIDSINLCKLNGEKKSVLDIGCAYGPFLKAASEKNWEVFGTDICEDAVLSVKNELGFSACVSSFPDIDLKNFGIEKFDAVTMWYVIEHFKNLDEVLQKVSELLKTGGVFAFSTPSGEGVSCKTNKDDFYFSSPTDHFSVWEPSRAQKILSKYNFKIVRKVSTGHHPERFPEIKKSGAKKDSDLRKKIDELSHRKNLGDTVEIYCVKI